MVAETANKRWTIKRTTTRERAIVLLQYPENIPTTPLTTAFFFVHNPFAYLCSISASRSPKAVTFVHRHAGQSQLPTRAGRASALVRRLPSAPLNSSIDTRSASNTRLLLPSPLPFTPNFSNHHGMCMRTILSAHEQFDLTNSRTVGNVRCIRR